MSSNDTTTRLTVGKPKYQSFRRHQNLPERVCLPRYQIELRKIVRLNYSTDTSYLSKVEIQQCPLCRRHRNHRLSVCLPKCQTELLKKNRYCCSDDTKFHQTGGR